MRTLPLVALALIFSAAAGAHAQAPAQASSSSSRVVATITTLEGTVGGQPTQGALQVSAASLVDPSSGDYDLDLLGQSVESVEVLANPFAAEYGRFSTSVIPNSSSRR